MISDKWLMISDKWLMISDKWLVDRRDLYNSWAEAMLEMGNF